VNPVRGVDVMVTALRSLPDVHIGLVTLHPSGRNDATEELLSLAEDFGVADRVHALPYVPHAQVARYLASADAGVIPLHHQPNHEIALVTKFFEYSHARLPIIVSDVRTMAETVRATGQGEVFRAGDVEDYVRAVKVVLADPVRYRAAYDRPGLLRQWSWEAQAEVLDAVYRSLVPDP
jgi:glycosyltransferase involved in cell wall biosynthesis